MFRSITNNTSKNFSAGGTISGDVTIDGDLTVSGGIGLTLSEVIQGTSTIDVTNTEALLIRKDSDSGDVFVVDTQNTRVGVGNTAEVNFHIKLADTANARIEDTSSGGIAKLDFKNDVRTATIGVYGDDSNNFKIDHGGGPVLTINTAQNIGIGTTSPQKKVDIVQIYSTGGSSNEDLQLLIRGGNADLDPTGDSIGLGFGYGSADNYVKSGIVHEFTSSNGSGTLHFCTSSVSGTDIINKSDSKMSISSAGNVSIGNASPSPVHADYSSLQIGGQGLIFSNTTAGADKSLYIGNNVFRHTDGSWDTVANDESMLYEQHGGKHYFYIAPAHASVSSLATKFVIDANSRISLSNNGGEATNTIFGYQAGNTIHSSSGMNTFVGHQVADTSNDADADENTAVGHLALSGLTSGAKNVAIGSYTGINITSGDENVLIGRSAGNNHNSSDLVGIGTATLASISDAAADGTVAVGYNALTALTSGGLNTVLGYKAGGAVTTGASNVFIGHQSGQTTHTDSTANVAIGRQSFAGTHTGSGCASNIAIGNLAMGAGACNGANNNVAVGDSALEDVTIADGNVALGYAAGTAITTGEGNVCIGKGAGDGFDAENYNIFIGEDAGGGAINGADKCIAIGKSALDGAITGDGTIAIGHDALTALTSGAGNTAVGYKSLTALTDGERNTVVGYEAGIALSSGTNNTVFGYEALKNEDGHGKNTVFGTQALFTLNAGADGHNTAIGFQSGDSMSTGTSNTLVGSSTGRTIAGGTTNTIVGKDSNVADAGATNRNAFGSGITLGVNNSVVLGNNDVTDVYMAQDSGATVHCANINLGGASSSGANVLDDYEEGDHTVSGTDDSGTFTLQSGGDTLTYTKIGRQVTVAGELQINDLSSAGSGGLRFSLPFAVADQTETGDRFVGTVQTRNVDYSANVVSACAKAVVGTQYFYIVEIVDNGVESSLASGSFATNDEVTVTLTYFTS